MQILIFLLALAISSISFGLDCYSPETSVYFGNGMFNSRWAAKVSQQALQRTLIKNGIVPEDTNVKIAYNLNESALEEPLQVATQKQNEYGRDFWLWLSNLSLAPKGFRDLAENVSRTYDYVRYVRDQDLKAHTAAYHAEIASGRNVLIIPHSQGNFYANSAWHLLNLSKETKGHFFIVSTASPASYIAGGGPYTSLSHDIVINAVRAATRALPSNATNSKSSFSGHEFVSQYLDGNRSGPKMLADIRKTFTHINDTFTSVGKDALAYQDQSLWPFLRYACLLKNQPGKFTASQCVALSALAKTYDWFGEEKPKRNLSSLIQWINHCEKNSWHDANRFDFNECTLLGDLPSTLGSYEGRTILDFVAYSHPECQWQGQEVGHHTTPPVVEEARRLLHSPPVSTPAKFK